MGACISLSPRATASDDLLRRSPAPNAAVISISGELHRHELPITAGQLSESESGQSFVCNSDALVYGDFIPALNPSDELLAGNLYFILPESKLHRRISGADMAALALKASRALKKEEAMQNLRRNNKCSQISPIRVFNNNNNNNNNVQNNVGTIGSVDTTSAYARSGSVRKFKKIRSRRMRVFRLSTIYEGYE